MWLQYEFIILWNIATDPVLIYILILQVMRIADQGADIVRITVQGKKEADACFEIKNSLVQKKYVIRLSFIDI